MNYSPDLTWATIKMILSLGLVLAIVWGLYRVAKKRLPMIHGSGNGRHIQVVENHYLGVKKQITMVRVPGSILVLGIGADQMSLLTQIVDPAIIQSIEAVQAPSKTVRFKDQLRRFTHSGDTNAPPTRNKTVVV
jgi:flagellar protein FliO/FliZ